jgi:hypothetical protein
MNRAGEDFFHFAPSNALNAECHRRTAYCSSEDPLPSVVIEESV